MRVQSGREANVVLAILRVQRLGRGEDSSGDRPDTRREDMYEGQDSTGSGCQATKVAEQGIAPNT